MTELDPVIDDLIAVIEEGEPRPVIVDKAIKVGDTLFKLKYPLIVEPVNEDSQDTNI